MKALLLVAIVLVHTATVYGQGYAWEVSPRQPHIIPKTFIGVEATMSYALYPASLSYIEQTTGLRCCTYEDGTGVPIALAVVGERWVGSQVKISAGAGVSMAGASFVAPTQPIPLSNGQTLRTEYVLDGSLTYASGFGSVSLRLGRSHVLATLGARVHAYLTGTLTQRERIVSPDGLTFTGQQPSREVILGQTFLDHATPVVVEPFAQFSYDIPLSYGIVLQPSILVGMPLGSLTTNDDWGMRSFGIGLRLVKGLFVTQ